MFMMGNLYSPDPSGWYGSGIYPNELINDYDGIKGKYKREPGKIEQALSKLFNMRKELKSQGVKGGKELAIKIVINTAYGVSGSPRFKNLFNITTASDCTAMARRTILYARKVFEQHGYECIYTDTDSIYIKDHLDDVSKLDNIAKQITDQQRKDANIPIETHCLERETGVKWMYFFRDEKGEFVKKHYIYLTDENKITMRGVRIVRGDCSDIAKMVFDLFIKPKVMKGESILFSPEKVLSWVKMVVNKNPESLAMRYRAKPFNSYKSETCIHAQIAKRYGQGEHFMVRNRRMGVGKVEGRRIAPVGELKEKYGEEWINYVVLDTYVNDLKEFIHWDQRKKIDKLR